MSLVCLRLGGDVEFRAFCKNGGGGEIQTIEGVEALGTGSMFGSKLTISHFSVDGDGVDFFVR